MSDSPLSTPEDDLPSKNQQSPEVRYVPATSNRPTGVTVFAILNVLFGITGVLGVVVTVLLTVFGDQFDFGANPIMDVVADNPTYKIYTVVMSVVGFIFAVVLIASGIGLFKMKLWGRSLALVYAVYAIVATIVGNVANYFFIFKPVMEQAVGGNDMQDLAVMSGILGGVVGGCIALILPIAILIYFLRPSVKKVLT